MEVSSHRFFYTSSRVHVASDSPGDFPRGFPPIGTESHGGP